MLKMRNCSEMNCRVVFFILLILRFHEIYRNIHSKYEKGDLTYFSIMKTRHFLAFIGNFFDAF